MNKLVFASTISTIEQSDIFMTVKARICEAPAANLNGARVTENFISEIVDNKERYVGLPLYADVRALTNGQYRRLGHLYDSKTGEFHSTQIGSFYDFEKEELDEGCALVGYARIAKRNKKLSNAITELWSDGALKFSFEVTVGEYEELDDGTILIDASDSNYLEGTAIVTFPACEDAVALQLVAQQAEQSVEADDIKGGEKEMADKEILAAEEVAEQPVEQAETVEEVAEVVEETAEVIEETEEIAEEVNDNPAETPAVENAEQENAAVVVHETHEETQAVHAFDTESGDEIDQRVTVETHTSHIEPDAQIVEATDGPHIAEKKSEDEEESVLVQPEVPAEPEEDTSITSEVNKKTAEQMIAELAEIINSLKEEIAELKETKVVAEVKTAEVNPLMADIHSEGKYSLLEKEEKVSSYSLLSR